MPNFSQGSVFALPEMVSVCGSDTTPSALEEDVIRLYDESRRPMLRYLTSLGIPPSDGEEIVQETFFHLFRHLQQGKSGANLRAWTFRVARNLALHRYRSKRRKPEELFGLAFASAMEPVDPLPNPEENAITEHRQRRLLAALTSLSNEEQQGVHLRADGLSYREIAQILGIPLTTLSRVVNRALTKLRRVDEE